MRLLTTWSVYNVFLGLTCKVNQLRSLAYVSKVNPSLGDSKMMVEISICLSLEIVSQVNIELSVRASWWQFVKDSG